MVARPASRASFRSTFHPRPVTLSPAVLLFRRLSLFTRPDAGMRMLSQAGRGQEQQEAPRGGSDVMRT